MNYIINRDGKTIPFKIEKITNAVKKALDAVGVEENKADSTAQDIAREVSDKLELDMKGKMPGVEDIQDYVENALIANNLADAAKAYIVYRRKHQLMRESSSGLNAQLKELFDSSSIESDLKRDNANIDGDSAMGTMLQVGAAASKSFYAANYLTDEERAANQSGDIHIHDFDFYALTETCCQIDFKALG